MANGNFRSYGDNIYEITTEDGKRIRLAIRNGKTYIYWADVIRLIGIKNSSYVMATNTEFFTLEIKTPWRTGNKGGKVKQRFISLDNAATFVRNRLN